MVLRALRLMSGGYSSAGAVPGTSATMTRFPELCASEGHTSVVIVGCDERLRNLGVPRRLRCPARRLKQLAVSQQNSNPARTESASSKYPNSVRTMDVLPRASARDNSAIPRPSSLQVLLPVGRRRLGHFGGWTIAHLAVALW